MNVSLQIEAAEVGNIKKIRIRHDNKGLGAGWFLDTVSVSAQCAVRLRLVSPIVNRITPFTHSVLVSDQNQKAVLQV